MHKPIVSFCITTFERYEILEKLILSILSVNSTQFEIVVSDDCSDDNSIEKLKSIYDERLKIHVNEKRLGALQNMYEALEHGTGKYLFFVNDRDNIDFFKIEKLIQILIELERKNVAYAKCTFAYENTEKYQIFKKGKDALIQFSCRIDHPSGYIFKKDIWKKIKGKRKFFENEYYGDYPITQICAIMALKFDGAVINGNICDILNQRIDFAKEKSRYHWQRKDKRMWYSPEIIFKELEIGQIFLKRIGVEKAIREQILINRYAEGLYSCMTDYRNKIIDPVCTLHYDIKPHKNFLNIIAVSVWNGIKLWSRTNFMCVKNGSKLCSQINQISKREYANYFTYILRNDFCIKMKSIEVIQRKDDEIYKREEALKIYERWLDAILDQKKVSAYLFMKGYHHVAIYGMGRIGKHLLKEFANSNIQVDYVIDKKISKENQYYEGVLCIDPEIELPYVDIIIVTVAGDSEIIANELRKKVACPIKSMNDILFVAS